jgi:uncharacterized protein YdhG (YjbR/CyaY superfamily)
MKAYKNIDEYISNFPEEVQVKLQQIRALISRHASGAREAISYGIPTFKLNGNLVHFAAFKAHLGFYPGASGIEAFGDQLGNYHTSKGTVQFPLDKPLPVKLIADIVKFRVQQNLGKAGKN